MRAALINGAWLLLDRVLRISISIFVGSWVARHLGPVHYGELAYVLSLLALFQVACTLGLDGPVVRDIVEKPEQASSILGAALGLRIGAGVIGWIAAIAIMVWLRPGDQAALMMIVISGASLVFQPAEVIDLWLQSQSQSRLTIPLRFFAYIIVALGKIILIITDAPLWAFSAAALSEVLFVTAALVLFHFRRSEKLAWIWNISTAKILFFESWPLMLAAVSISIYVRIDQIILRELADERQLGIYSAIVPFSQAWYMVPMIIYSSILPRLAQLQKEDKYIYQRRLQQTFTLMTWGGISAAAATAACAPWLVNTLLGARYLESIPVLQVHVMTNAFVFMGVAQNLVIVNERTPHVAMFKALVGAAVCVIANTLFIPRWGALGSAWAALTSHLFSTVLLNLVIAPGAFRMQLRALMPIRDLREIFR